LNYIEINIYRTDRHSLKEGDPIITWMSVLPPNMDWTPDVRSGVTVGLLGRSFRFVV
jgi:hypothetical protein